MATSAIIGHGTLVGYSTTGVTTPTSFTSLTEVYEVSLPDTEVDEVEATHYGSANNFKEFIAGLEDGGEVEVQLNYTKTQCDTLDLMRRTIKEWLITMPDVSYWRFPGYIKKMSGAIPDQDKVSVKVTIRVTGRPEFIPGA